MTTRELTWTEKLRNDLKDRIDRMGGLEVAFAEKVVSAKIVESYYDVFQIGKAVKQIEAQGYWITKDMLSDEQRAALGKFGRNVGYILTPTHSGQGGGGGDNVRVVVEPYWGDKGGKYLDIEVGCSHQIHSTRLGNCYYKYNCTKCGFWYEVDSGD